MSARWWRCAVLALALASCTAAEPSIPVLSVAVTPVVDSLLPSATLQLTAVVRDANGRPLDDRTVSWSSSAPAIADVTANGLVTAVSPGLARVVASADGVTDTALITVLEPVASVRLASGADTIVPPQTVLLAAEVLDASGRLLSGRLVTWSTDRPDIATVGSTGVVQSVALGVATIRATVEGQWAEAAVTVAPILTVSPRLPTVFAGDTVALGVHASDLTGSALTVPPIAWGSADPAVATIGPDGVARGVAPGFVRVTARGGGAEANAVVAVLGPRMGVNREIGFLVQDLGGVSVLHAVLPDGSAESRLTDPGEHVSDYSWSPDGSRLAIGLVTVNGLGKHGAYLMTMGDSTVTPIPGAATDQSPTWSPDGALIVSLVTVSNAESNLYVFGADGGNRRRLTLQSGRHGFANWSPDSRRLAYVRFPDPASERTELWVVDADGTHEAQVPLPLETRNPRWSPDGKRIAFDNGNGIWAVNPDGSHLEPLSSSCTPTRTCTPGRVEEHAAWSPDGQRIAYREDFFVVLRAVGGTEIARVPSRTCCFDVRPEWSPDGALVAFSSPQLVGTPWPGVYVMGADGSGPRFVTGSQNAGFHRWRP